MIFDSNLYTMSQNQKLDRPGDFEEQRTGIVFPEIIGTLKRGNITAYEAEPKKVGVSIEYRSEDAEVTVYVRALGEEGHKNSTDFLNESLAGIKALEAQGQYCNVKIYGFEADKEKPGWKSAAFTSRSTNHFIVSFIHCKIVAGNLVKIRASTRNPKIDSLQSFTRSVQEIVDNAPSNPC